MCRLLGSIDFRASEEHARSAPSGGVASPLVGVSYVMPVLNDVTHVRAAVESILAQDYAGPVEVLIAARTVDRRHRASWSPTSRPRDAAHARARERGRLDARGPEHRHPRCAVPGRRARRLALDAAAPTTRASRSRRARAHRRRQRRRHHGRPRRDAVRARRRAGVHHEGRPRRLGVPRRRARGPGRDRVPRRASGATALERVGLFDETHQARPGLGAQPPPARDRRHRVVHARARGHLPSALERRAPRPADVLDRPLARRARTPVPGGERHPLLHPAGHGARRRRSASSSASPASCRPPSGRRRGCCSGFVVPAVYLLFVVAATLAYARGRRRRRGALVSRSLAVHTRLVGCRASCSATSR